MENLVMFNLIAGFLAPIIVSTINQPNFNARARIAVMIGVSIVFGGLTAYFAGEFVAVDVITGILITITAAITAYKGIFKPSGLADKIEAKTSPEPEAPYKANQAG